MLSSIAAAAATDSDRAQPERRARFLASSNLTEAIARQAIAVAMQLGELRFDFPKHPDESRSQTDNDTQEHQRQSRDREHV